MLKKLILISAGLIIGLATLGTAIAEEPSLKEQILAIDKELVVMRRSTLSDPKVKAAQAQLQLALIRLKETEDDVLMGTDPKGKELVEKFRKLLLQYQVQQKAEAAKKNPKPQTSPAPNAK